MKNRKKNRLRQALPPAAPAAGSKPTKPTFSPPEGAVGRSAPQSADVETKYDLRLDSTFDFSPDKKFAPPKPFNYNQPSAYGLTRKLFQWLLDTV